MIRHLINRIRWEIWFYKSIWDMPPIHTVDADTWEILSDRRDKSEPVEGRPRR